MLKNIKKKMPNKKTRDIDVTICLKCGHIIKSRKIKKKVKELS